MKKPSLFDVDECLSAGNRVKAFQLCKKIADDTDDADVMVCMARFYENGIGTPTDYAEAMKWYIMAQGYWWVNALYKLGYFYENGLGVRRDIDEAILYYAYSVEQHAIDWEKSWEALERLSPYNSMAQQAIDRRGTIIVNGKLMLPHSIKR